MCGPFIPALQQFLSRLRYITARVILPLKINYILQGIECHDRNKLNLIRQIPAKQLYTPVSGYRLGLNTGEYLIMKQILIEIRVLLSGPAMPHAFDSQLNPPFDIYLSIIMNPDDS
jgi:hypothetical protein